MTNQHGPSPMCCTIRTIGIALAALTAVAVCFDSSGISQDAAGTLQKAERAPTSTEPKDGEARRLTPAEARARAQLLHESYESTLRALHRHYFREQEKQPVPSRVLEDVFHDLSRRSKIQARWIVVNANAMDIDHEPKDDFEKLAARQLASGKEQFERVEGGIYRSARSIHLAGACLKCHAPAPMRPDVNRVAGLVISIPVIAE